MIILLIIHKKNKKNLTAIFKLITKYEEKKKSYVKCV